MITTRRCVEITSDDQTVVHNKGENRKHARELRQAAASSPRANVRDDLGAHPRVHHIRVRTLGSRCLGTRGGPLVASELEAAPALRERLSVRGVGVHERNLGRGSRGSSAGHSMLLLGFLL